MRRQLSLETRRELKEALRARYQEADREKKRAILDEFVAVAGYHRKHAIRLLRKELGVQESPRRKGKSLYDEATRQAVILLWEAADRICGKRLKALLPALIEAMERHGHLQLDTEVRALLLRISASTIDRLLGHVRETGKQRRSGIPTALRKAVPVRTFNDWKDPVPGNLEADFVCHCGPVMGGSFVYTFVLTDIATGWTECIALPARGQNLVVEALDRVRTRLPFPLVGFDTDNDPAFLNDSVLHYCQKHGIAFTRSRPYRKNDQAWVEQKNGAIVRRLTGYKRLEGMRVAATLAELYEYSRLYVNFLQPSFKLKSKTREGARVRKQYHAPATPYERLLASDQIPDTIRNSLRLQFAELDPIHLLEQIRKLQARLAAIADHSAPDASVEADVAFLKHLSTAWKEGEVRPTHRKRKRSRYWRTRRDPFEKVWPLVRSWLEEKPDSAAKDLFLRLQQEGPGKFAPGQLRTLQRRVKQWRCEMARHLVLGQAQVA
jgi:hypothetical protein